VKRPVVGVTTYLEQARWGIWDQPAALIPQSYVDGVAKAGGLPVLLPPSGGRAEDAIDVIDALVLSGGADVDPAHYGEAPHPRTVTRPDRDEWELALLRAALARRRPVLAICRGMQLLNVACGGTLYQHLPEVVDNSEHQPAPGVFGINHVRITPASRLARILGRRSTVSCHHHQAVQVLGDGLGPAAWAIDETIEAIEHFEHDFVVGVQWHPEEGPKDGLLFTALVQAAILTGTRSITSGGSVPAPASGVSVPPQPTRAAEFSGPPGRTGTARTRGRTGTAVVAGPAEAAAPARPAEPVRPAGTTEPAEAADHGVPAGTAGTGEPAGPEVPSGTATNGSATTAGSTATTDPTATAGSATSGDPTATAGSATGGGLTAAAGPAATAGPTATTDPPATTGPAATTGSATGGGLTATAESAPPAAAGRRKPSIRGRRSAGGKS